VKYLFILLVLINGSICFSFVQGQIVDIDSKNPIQGVNVYVEESGVGSVTDEYGMFFLKSETDKINISHIGYLDIEYNIINKTNLMIFLEPSVINSEELVVTGTRTLKTFKDSPVLTRIISNQEIKDSQSRDLYDVMDEIFPGYQKLKGQHAMSNEIRFNGLGTKSVLFMIDGQKINAEYGGNMDLSVVDINSIDKIEYVDGAISTLYGSGAMGGAVNIITKKTSKNSYDLNVNLFSDAPSVKSGHLSYAQNFHNIDGSVSITFNQSDGFDLKELEYSNDNDQIQKHQEEFSNIILNGNIGYSFDNSRLGINHKRYSSSINTYKMDDMGGGPLAELAIVPDFELPRNYDTQTSFKFNSKIGSSVLLDYCFTVEDYEKKYEYTSYGEHLWSGSYSDSHTLIINKSLANMEFLFGLDVVNDKYKSYNIDGNGDWIDSNENGVIDAGDQGIDEFSIFDDSNSKQTSLRSIFINNEWLLNSISVTSGLRYQHHDVYDGHFIPMLSLYKKFDKYKFRSTWSQGFRAPNLKELYYQWDHPGGVVMGNSNLQPEESEYFSLSLESFKDFYYSVNIYHNSLKNMINYITSGDSHTYTNFEKVSLKGFNIFYKRKLSGNGELTFSYNYLDAHDHVLNARLNGSNFHNLNTKLTYFLLDNLKTRLSFKYSSPKKYAECVQNCGGDSSDDIFELSAFSLVDFSLRYDLSKSISATLGINNVFDYKDSNATTEQFLTLVNPGRTIVFGFDYNLRGFSEK